MFLTRRYTDIRQALVGQDSSQLDLEPYLELQMGFMNVQKHYEALDNMFGAADRRPSWFMRK